MMVSLTADGVGKGGDCGGMTADRGRQRWGYCSGGTSVMLENPLQSSLSQSRSHPSSSGCVCGGREVG